MDGAVVNYNPQVNAARYEAAYLIEAEVSLNQTEVCREWSPASKWRAKGQPYATRLYNARDEPRRGLGRRYSLSPQ